MESTMGSYTPDQEQSPKRSTVLLTVERGQKGERMTSSELRSILEEELGKKEGLEERRKELEAVVKREILKRASTDYDKIKYLANRCTTLKGHMSKISKEKLPNRLERPDIYTYFDNMTQLEKAFAYLRAVKFVKECSEKIEANLESGLRSEAIDIFQFLLKLKQSHVSSTECGNFRNYFNETVSYWEHCLVERFVKETQKLLDAFGWPSGLATSTPTLETHDKFRRTISCMIRLSSCSSAAAPSGISQEERPALVKDFKEPLLPIKVMVEPLKKRFKYHFFVNKITSDPTRPEWYFTQIKSWARDLIPFIRTHVEPLVLEAHLSAVADFISALSEMLIIKADSQLSSSSDQIEDTIFARILEESIIFENEMGNFLGEDLEDKKIYIPPFVSTLFSQPHVLQRWLAIERKACLEKMDEMFSSPNSWDRAVVPGPTEVEDLFMAVLRFVIDRFAHLQQQSQKVLFLKLLVDMIDDFRVRCLQTWKSRRVIEADYKDDVLIDYIIADTLRSIQTTIESWEDLPFFASISFFLGSAAENGEDGEMSGSPVNETLDADHSVSRDDPSGFSLDLDLFLQVSKDEDQGAQIGSPYQGLFSNVLKLYECLGEDILRKWCITAVKELRADILPNYARRKWHMFPPTGFEENGATVSEGVLNAIQRLKALSKGVSTGMNPDFAQIWLKRLAIQFDEMLMDTLVYPNRFTPGAFIQLRYDMEFGIFPVFADCNIPTGMFLVGMTSTLRIWEMPIGKVLLVWDALTDPSASFEAQEEVLAELELALRPSDVVKLLKTRADINL